MGYGQLHDCSGKFAALKTPMAQAELLTKAQILLTAFIAGLDPRICDQTSSATLRAGLDEMVTFDA